MPDETKQLIGRSNELSELRQLLERGRIVAIVGMGGMGKTTLARHIAVVDAGLYPGGIHLVDGYHVGSGPLDATAPIQEQVRQQSQRDRTLLIIDGIDELPTVHAEALLYLAAHGGVHLRTLVTSRQRIPQADFTLSLEPLLNSDVEQLLKNGGVLDSAAHELAPALGGHPLAAVLAGSAIAEGLYSPAEFLTYLENFRTTGVVLPGGQALDVDAPTSTPVRLEITTINDELLRTLERDIHRARDLSSRKFEELVAELLARQGYSVELTPASKDGGKDIYVAKRDDLGTFLYLVECKRYALDNPVGVEVVRALHGTVQAERATAGILVTTSVFTRGAVDFQRHLQYQLSLRDYVELHRWVRKVVRPEC